MTAFSKTIARSIRNSLGRFLAIVGIVALGCGFFAGLKMSGADMRSSADAYYDQTNLYDIQLACSLGFSQKDVARVKAIDGVERAAPSRSCDAMVAMKNDQVTTRIQSLAQNDPQGDINQLVVCEGRLPKTGYECVIGADAKTASVGDTVRVLFGTDEMDDLLQERTFEVVGTVRSSRYPYGGNYGSTTLGSGLIDQYLFTTSSAFKEDAPFTEIGVLANGTRSLKSGSGAYQSAVDELAGRIEDRRQELADARLEDLRTDAQDELDKNRAKYNKERADALDELEDAQNKLDDGKRDLDDARKQLDDARREYGEGVDQLRNSRTEAEEKLDDAQATIDDSRAQLEEKTGELEDARMQLEDGKLQYEEGVQQILSQTNTTTLEQAKESLQDGLSQAEGADRELEASIENVKQLVEQREQLEEGQAELLSSLANMGVEAHTTREAASALETMISQLEQSGAPEDQIAPLRDAHSQATQIADGLDQVEVARSQLLQGLARQGIHATDEADAQTQLETHLKEVRNAEDQARQGLDAIARLEQTATDLEDAQAQLEDGEAQLAEGHGQLEQGQEELNREAQNAYDELEKGEVRLTDAHSQIVSGEEELESGTQTYESSHADYDKARTEAMDKLADGKKKLDDAQDDIDELETPDIYVLDRTKNEGVSSYQSDSERIDSIADVFPLMFFLVAALVALTTMTRMVEDDRIELGTFKALGYGTMRIASKYLIYAGIAGGAGALIGIAVLSQVLPYVIVVSYASMYEIPVPSLPLAIDPLVALASGGLGVGVTLLATWAAVVSSLRETPANLMLPRAPAAGKRILLERLTPVWSRLSFSWKVTFRNLFRYKRRLAMTVVGISGCTALLLVGFGLRDSIWDIVARQFGPIIHYNATITLDEDATEDDIDDLETLLKSDDTVRDVVRGEQKNVRIGLQEGSTTYAQAIVPYELSDLKKAFTLQERSSGKTIDFDDASVVIAEKVADTYGLSAGDTIWLFDLDATGNAKGEGKPATVCGITENYVGSPIYLGKEAWQSLEDDESEDPEFKTLYVVTQGEPLSRSLTDALRKQPEVSTMTLLDETIELQRKSISVVDICVLVLIASAGALAFVVLYNLTNINVAERVREIASLKVLGFTRAEVYSYIFREMLLLCALGDVLGLAFGAWLEGFVVVTAETDYLMFGRSIHPPSYLYAFALTLVFCVLIMFGMRGKLDRISMVESLKSVD